jgi:hypothetical protein
MVAINSIPQQDVANGRGHNEWERAKPITLSKEVAKKPDPSMPGGASTILMSLMIQNEKRFIPTKNEPQIYNILEAIDLN